MINSRKLSDLDPAVRKICEAHVRECKHRGIEIIVTSTWRDFESQTALYAIGRTVQKDRRSVTKARAGKSWHNFRAAWDVVGIVSGKPIWDAGDPVWREIIKIGKTVGALAGADWPTFPDLPHFYCIPDKITLAVALRRWQDNGTIFV